LTLALASLPPWWLAAAGLLGRDLEPLRWIALFAAPTLSASLLLSTVYFSRRGVDDRLQQPSTRLLLAVSGGLFLLLCGLLATPALLFPELPASTLQLLERSRGRLDTLRDRALMDPDPRRRLEAAWAVYLRTGQGTMFMDDGGDPAVFEPNEMVRRQLTAHRWLALRPGVLPWERRLLAAGDALLIVLVLAAVPVASLLGRHHAPLAPPPPF
jgi:hypothetical protein